jgi:hypothetical protein
MYNHIGGRIMTKAFLKLPLSPALGKVLILGQDDWMKIDASCGWSLSRSIRNQISLATLRLTSGLAREEAVPRFDGTMEIRYGTWSRPVIGGIAARAPTLIKI